MVAQLAVELPCGKKVNMMEVYILTQVNVPAIISAAAPLGHLIMGTTPDFVS